MSKEDDYEVGYGRPPKHTRFKKGKSGNPKGRPKGTRNFRKDLEDVLKQRVTLREGDRERKVSTQLAIIKRTAAKALQGDTKAANMVVNWTLSHLSDEVEESAATQLPAADKRIIEELLGVSSPTEKNVRPRPRPKSRSKPSAKGE